MLLRSASLCMSVRPYDNSPAPYIRRVVRGFVWGSRFVAAYASSNLLLPVCTDSFGFVTAGLSPKDTSCCQELLEVGCQTHKALHCLFSSSHSLQVLQTLIDRSHGQRTSSTSSTATMTMTTTATVTMTMTTSTNPFGASRVSGEPLL